MTLRQKKAADSVERLYGSVKVEQEADPKKVAREWARKRVEREIS